MKPPIPLQQYLKFLANRFNPLDISQIQTLLRDWEEDYILMQEIKKIPCTICEPKIHWIKKLECPKEIYKKGFDFLTYYQSLQELIIIANQKEKCMNFYNEFKQFSHSPNQLLDWKKRVKEFYDENDGLFHKVLAFSIFVFDDDNNLIAVKPFDYIEFGFEVLVKPDAFIEIANFYKLLIRN